MNKLYLVFFSFLFVKFTTLLVDPHKVGREPQSEARPCKTVKQYTDIHSKAYARDFPETREKQLQLMGTYLNVLKGQMARMISGINIETYRNPNSRTVKYYQNYLGELMFQSAYISDLYHQLKEYDLNTACQAFAFKEVKIEEKDLLKRLELAQFHGEKEGLIAQVSVGIAQAMVDNVLQDVVIGTGRVVKNMIIQRAISGGIKALKNSVTSSVIRGVVIGAAKGVVVGFVIDQLKSGTIPLETTWIELAGKNPELLLNPEWMRAAGIQTQIPWQVHMIAHRNRPESMDHLKNHLMKHTKQMFQARVLYLSKKEAAEEKAEWEKKFPTAYAESTGVHKATHPMNDLPYWAQE